MSEMSLLYVEDDLLLREQFARVLRPTFKHYYEAADGAEALTMFETHRPDIMIVDINLPKIDGLDLIARIRAHDKETPIVILSAYSDQAKLLRAVKLGLSDYLVKPVPHKKLIGVLGEIAMNYDDPYDRENLINFHNGYIWKKEEKLLSHHGQNIPLTKREILLLDHMMKHPKKIYSIQSLEGLILEHNESADPYSALSHLLKRLRKKLPEPLIENIYGEGYRLIHV